MPSIECVKLYGRVDDKYKAMDYAFELPHIKRVEFRTPLTDYFLENILDGMSRAKQDELTCTLDADSYLEEHYFSNCSREIKVADFLQEHDIFSMANYHETARHRVWTYAYQKKNLTVRLPLDLR